MNNHSLMVRERLNHAIQHVSKHRKAFVKDPNKDFVRNRELPMSKVIHFLLGLKANSLETELLHFYKSQPDVVTSSAMIQARHKIKISAFKFIFDSLVQQPQEPLTYNGYRLLAHDGSDLNIPLNRKDTATYTRNGENEYNLLHLNALYDVLNKSYEAFDLQDKHEVDERQSLVNMVENITLEMPLIFIADRGYESLNVYEHMRCTGQKFIIRAKDINSNGLLSKIKLPKTKTFDTQVEFKLTRRQTKEVKVNPTYHFLSTRQNLTFFLKNQKHPTP